MEQKEGKEKIIRKCKNTCNYLQLRNMLIDGIGFYIYIYIYIYTHTHTHIHVLDSI